MNQKGGRRNYIHEASHVAVVMPGSFVRRYLLGWSEDIETHERDERLNERYYCCTYTYETYVHVSLL